MGTTLDVLDHGYVTLDSVMGTDYNIIKAARMSYNKDLSTPEKDRRLIKHLINSGHTSPFEQVEIRLKVRAPLIVCWQWFRHRTWSYSVSSGRYTELDKFYVPDDWPTDFMVALENHYKVSYALYQIALENGIKKEQARLFLPGFSMYYTFYAKTDAHNLMHFLRVRLDSAAQWEIRQYAKAVLNIFDSILPITSNCAKEKYGWTI